MFDNLETPEDIKERGDKLGGFSPFESGITNFKIALAYADESKGGAKSLNLHLKEIDGARVLRTTLWVTSGKAKGGKPFFLDKNGDKQWLPGAEMANDLCLMTVGYPLIDPKGGASKVKFAEKQIMLYSYDEKGEVPTDKMVAIDLMGKDITAGVLQTIVDKNIDDGTGNYVPSGETRTVVEVDKFFRLRDGLTVTEIKAKSTEAKFLAEWESANKDRVVDKTIKSAGPPPSAKGGNGASPDNPFA